MPVWGLGLKEVRVSIFLLWVLFCCACAARFFLLRVRGAFCLFFFAAGARPVFFAAGAWRFFCCGCFLAVAAPGCRQRVNE